MRAADNYPPGATLPLESLRKECLMCEEVIGDEYVPQWNGDIVCDRLSCRYDYYKQVLSMEQLVGAVEEAEQLKIVKVGANGTI